MRLIEMKRNDLTIAYLPQRGSIPQPSVKRWVTVPRPFGNRNAVESGLNRVAVPMAALPRNPAFHAGLWDSTPMALETRNIKPTSQNRRLTRK